MNFKTRFEMKWIKYKTALLFSALLMLSATSDTSIKPVNTQANSSSYGKIFGDHIVYIGIDSTLATMNIWYKNLNDNDEFKINSTQYSIPIGWLNDKTVLLSEKEGNIKRINTLDIATGNRKQLLEINSVVSPERDVCIDNDIIVFVCQSTEKKDIVTYKYNLNDNQQIPISTLKGKDIIRVAYSNENNSLAYIRIGKKGAKYLEIYDGTNITQIMKYATGNYAEEIPLIFSDDGTELFFVENKEYAIIKKYDLNTGTIVPFFEFPDRVKCIDLSYSKGKLLFTADVEDGDIITHEVNLNHNIKIEFENGRKLFFFEL